MIAIVNYGMGNLGSIKNMLSKIGYQSIITSEYKEIEKADKLILPGVGSFDTGMKNLRQHDLEDLLNNKVLIQKVPILGICLGVQLMTNKSEEGEQSGLGWFNAETMRFNVESVEEKLLLPNIGWRYVENRKESKICEGLIKDSRFYFVHSYHLKANNSEDILMSSNYGYDFTAALEKDNILGVQFHPEKSHSYGMRLLENFVKFF